MKKIGLLVIVLGLMMTFVGCKAEDKTDKSLNEALVALLPTENFKWSYKDDNSGYYHQMILDSIVVDAQESIYKVVGSVKEESEGLNPEDYEIELFYKVNHDSIVQLKNAKRMLDSEYDEMTLIKSPLKEGTKWTEDVKDSNGKTHTISASITKAEASDDGMVYEVHYNNKETGYSEGRRIIEGYGVVVFSKNVTIGKDKYLYGYGLDGDNSYYVSSETSGDTGSDEGATGNDEGETTEGTPGDDGEPRPDDSDASTDEGVDDDASEEVTSPEPDEGEDASYEVKKSIIAFNNAWIKYVNDDDRGFFDHVIKNGVAYTNAVNFDNAGITESFINMDITNIKVKDKRATAHVYEEIKKEKDGEVTILKYNWVYDLIQEEGQWYINGYKLQ